MDLDLLVYFLTDAYHALPLQLSDSQFDTFTKILLVFVSLGGATIAWLVRKFWKLTTQTIPDLESDIQTIKNSYFGVPEDESDKGKPARLQEDIEDIMDKLEDVHEDQRRISRRQHQDHAETRRFLLAITQTLKEHDINGNLPDEDEIRSDRDADALKDD